MQWSDLLNQLLAALYDGATAVRSDLRDALGTRTGQALATLIVLATVFGADRLASWVEAIGADGVMRIIAGLGAGLATVAVGG